MLDPSLFVDHGWESTFRMIEDYSDVLDFYVSKRFVESISEGLFFEEPGLQRFFGAYGSFSGIQRIGGILYSQENIRTFESSDFHTQYSGLYQEIQQAVGSHSDEYSTDREGEDILSEILFEELIFSLEMSPVLSRLKRISAVFSDVALSTITINKKTMNRVWRETQKYMDKKRSKASRIKTELEDNARRRLKENESNWADEPIWLSTLLREAVKQYTPNWIVQNVKTYIAKPLGPGLGALAGYYIGGPLGIFGGGYAGQILGDRNADFVQYLADP